MSSKQRGGGGGGIKKFEILKKKKKKNLFALFKNYKFNLCTETLFLNQETSFHDILSWIILKQQINSMLIVIVF